MFLKFISIIVRLSIFVLGSRNCSTSYPGFFTDTPSIYAGEGKLYPGYILSVGHPALSQISEYTDADI